jgi:N-acetylmuramoyl-L-alanine amidase
LIKSESILIAAPILLLAQLIAQDALAVLHPFSIVIDPGHGGTDEGTVYREGRFKVSEKEVTLALSKEVAVQLMSKGYAVALTRKEDREISLAERSALANQIGADVFISIHMNSSSHPASLETQGVETFILNHTTDATSRRLARFENTAQSDVALILKDLRLDGNFRESKHLACIVQSSLVEATSPSWNINRRNRGVKQALFYVLLGADMPAILIEAGFLNHPRDRTILLSSIGRRRVGQAIVRAIETFRLQKRTKFSSPSSRRCKIG